MKVVLLVSELEDYTISFANGLARHVTVILAVPRRSYAGLTSWIDPAVDLRLLDWPRHRSLRNLAFLPQLIRLVRAERPDVIHLLSHNALWLNLALPFWRGMPVITTVHDIEVHPGDAETRILPVWSTNRIVRQSGDIVVHGPDLRRAALQRFRRPASSVHVLSHPAITRYRDLARTEGLVRRTGDGSFRVLMFGRIYAYKGLAHLLTAEAILAGRIPGLRITIAGRGDDPAALAGLMGDMRRYDLRNRFIPDAEVAQLFLDADLVVLPYVEASQSGVLHLAAAFGKPVVATDTGELGRTLRDHGMGLVVPAADPAALAGAIEQMAGDPDLRNRCAAQALFWAQGPNAPERVGADAAALYRHVLHRKDLNRRDPHREDPNREERSIPNDPA